MAALSEPTVPRKAGTSAEPSPVPAPAPVALPTQSALFDEPYAGSAGDFGGNAARNSGGKSGGKAGGNSGDKSTGMAASQPADDASADLPSPGGEPAFAATEAPSFIGRPMNAALARLALPVALLDAQFRLLDINPAGQTLMGQALPDLLGLDFADRLEGNERAALLAERQQWEQACAAEGEAFVLRHRLVLGDERDIWAAATFQREQHDGQTCWLVTLQDESVEHIAREQSLRVHDELEQWFRLSGAGMLVYDASGLIVRSNAAFDGLVQQVPEVLPEASPELQSLLGWGEQGAHADLRPGRAPLLRQALIPLPDGRRRRLSARLCGFVGDEGHLRVMAVVDDRSAEDERDLAQLEMGVLMNAAGVGVSTFDPGEGWLAKRLPPAAAAATAPSPRSAASATSATSATPATSASTSASSAPAAPAANPLPGGALLAIGRELVAPESRAEYERLQQALRQGGRAEVRYAVRHPEHGLRWLLTRVEPGALAGGRATTSVVTLDVTEQEMAQRRNEQLLRELTTILDSSHAGIGYLRGPALVRCNQRFERMLGFEAGAAAGASLQEVLARQQAPDATVAAALEALEQGAAFEVELALPGSGRDDEAPRWVALSLRRAQSDSAPAGMHEAVAVVTDITRLKSQQAELESLLRDRELMFNLSEVGIAYMRGTRIERANQAMAAMTGWSVSELAALDGSVLHESARECAAFDTEVALAVQATGRYSGVRRLRRRDGSLIWVQVSARSVQADAPGSAGSDTVPAALAGAIGPELRGGSAGESGNTGPVEGLSAGGLICSFVDVDERHRARESLRQQAERTRAILNSVLVGIVTVSERGIEWMNRSARRMFAGELTDFVGSPISVVATPEPDHPLRRSDWIERVQQGPVETFECRLRGNDGREFWVVGNAVASAPAGEARQVTFALLDIEARRRAEVSIARTQASLQRLIETAPLAIALLDANSRQLRQLNQTAHQFFGAGLGLVIGQPLDAQLQPALAEALGRWLAALPQGGEPQVHEWQAPATGKAAARTWECRLAPLAAPDAGPEGSQEVMLLASDVTEQRAAEQARLEAAIAQREVLVREVHHRIKNNLQGVAGLLQQHAARRPEVASVLVEAVGQVQAIAQVYGLQVGAQGPLAIGPLVLSIAQSVQRTFGRAIEVVGAAVQQVLPEAEAIPVALTLNELLTNAIKHGGPPLVTGHDPVRCTVQVLAAEAGKPGPRVAVLIAGTGKLPESFDLRNVRTGVSGLSLVRALLPRRGALLSLEQHGPDVVARVELGPPAVREPLPAAASVTLPGSGA